MTIMKVSNPEDLEKWKKAIERLERVIPMTEQDATSTKKFYSNELETAQFWKGCAFEGADDKKLHEIAENNLQVVLNYEMLLDSLVPSALRNAIKLLKEDFSVTT